MGKIPEIRHFWGRRGEKALHLVSLPPGNFLATFHQQGVATSGCMAGAAIWYQMVRGMLANPTVQLCQVDGTLHSDRGRHDAEGCAAWTVEGGTRNSSGPEFSRSFAVMCSINM